MSLPGKDGLKLGNREILIKRIIEYVKVNGADRAILAAKEKSRLGKYTVLATYGTQFVTWDFQFDRGFYWGHYCGSYVEDGIEYFMKRD